MEETKLKFDEIENICSYVCVLGLEFPESATEFQKAALTLAHLSAMIRNYVLKGLEVPVFIVELCDRLSVIMESNKYGQR